MSETASPTAGPTPTSAPEEAGTEAAEAEAIGAETVAAEAEQPPAAPADAAEHESSQPARAEPDTALLVREGDLAADYIEGLLDILDFDGDIDMDVQNGRAVVGVSGSLQPLVGPRGATLEALQELTRLAVYRRTRTPSRMMLDVGGFRAARRRELSALARNAAEQVKEYGEAVRMSPMTAFERKCVHDVINDLAGVRSESEGEEPYRRVVVHPEQD